MKKLVFLVVLFIASISSSVLAQEDKDLKSFANMMVKVKKAPMEAKVLIQNDSEFAKNLELYPDTRYKNMNLAANWGTVAEKVVLLPESNKAVVNFLFAIRRVDLAALIAFQEEMNENEDANIVDAGIFNLEINTSRAKHITALAKFNLNGVEIVRNVNFQLEKIGEEDFGGELPIFKAVINDDLLGIPTLVFKAESGIPFDCFVENEDLGISFSITTEKVKKDIRVLAPNLPEDGVYKFSVKPIIGSYIVPKMVLPLLISDGKLMLKDNPFSLDAVSNGGNGKGNSLVTLRNERNVPITLLVPTGYVGKNSGIFAGKGGNYAADVSGEKKVNWTAIQIAPRSTTKVWLAKTFFNGLIVCGQETGIKTFHVENKSSQTIKIGW
ncbi:MAG: hypothetical protein ACOXZ1_01005 [Patescibacteria group bacterium]|jgi:hypothetical protein